MTTATIAQAVRPGMISRLIPAINAEWTKLRTIRSPRAMLIAGYIAVVGGGALLTFFINRNFSSLPAGVTSKIVCENAARLYNLSMD